MADPGTPLARLEGLADYAVKAGLCSGVEARAPELFLIDEIERLREEVKRERGFKESYLQSMNELLENRK